jgi:hypothetical protein
MIADGHELHACHHAMLAPAAADVFEAVRDTPAGEPAQPLKRQGRAQGVTGEPFAPEVVACVDAHTSVQVECVVKAKEEPMT